MDMIQPSQLYATSRLSAPKKPVVAPRTRSALSPSVVVSPDFETAPAASSDAEVTLAASEPDLEDVSLSFAVPHPVARDANRQAAIMTLTISFFI